MFKKSTVFILHFTPACLRFTLSLQSAFYTQSTFYPWSAVCSLQSAVRSLRFTLSLHFTRGQQSAVRSLQSPVCSPQSAVRSLRFTL